MHLSLIGGQLVKQESDLRHLSDDVDFAFQRRDHVVDHLVQLLHLEGGLIVVLLPDLTMLDVLGDQHVVLLVLRQVVVLQLTDLILVLVLDPRQLAIVFVDLLLQAVDLALLLLQLAVQLTDQLLLHVQIRSELADLLLLELELILQVLVFDLMEVQRGQVGRLVFGLLQILDVSLELLLLLRELLQLLFGLAQRLLQNQPLVDQELVALLKLVEIHIVPEGERLI